ncbi:MAG: sensor histidine kinase [Acidobacteriaceae bacterium]
MTVASPQQTPDRTLHDTPAATVPGEPRTAEASHLAHDVRNWLTVLQVYCDLLRTSGTVADRGLEWMEELSSAVERGQGLVHALVDSAQPSEAQHGGAPMEAVATAPFDLAVAIERRLPLLRQMAGRLIEVESRTVAQAGATALREPEFERILLNLVGNAIEAMAEGGTLRITLEPGDSLERRSLVLRVSDTGPGIAAKFLPRIFDSGFSTKRAGADPQSGHGFGLAIVRELAMGAGGWVRVRSIAGHGASFAVELPLVAESLSSESLPSNPRSPISGQRTLAVVSEMPKSKPDRHAQHNNFGPNRKGTRVPC